MNPTTSPDPWQSASPELQTCLARLRCSAPHLVARLKPNAPLVASGLDSLELVELLCAIESTFGLRLTTDALTASTTPLHLLHHITQRKASHNG